MGSLGRYLIDIAQMPEADFIEESRLVQFGMAQSRINKAEHTLQRFDFKPTFWAKAFSTRIALLRSEVIAPNYVFPRELYERFPGIQIPSIMKSIVEQFGQLLVLWPDICKAAQKHTAMPGSPIKA